MRKLHKIIGFIVFGVILAGLMFSTAKSVGPVDNSQGSIIEYRKITAKEAKARIDIVK